MPPCSDRSQHGSIKGKRCHRTEQWDAVQARYYQGQVARLAVEGVISCLIRIGKLHLGYSADRVAPRFLARKTDLLHGRDEEMRWLRERLGTDRAFSAAVIKGGAGAGKSALAMEFGMQLCEEGQLPGGAYVVNMAGGEPLPKRRTPTVPVSRQTCQSLLFALRGAKGTHVQCLPWQAAPQRTPLGAMPLQMLPTGCRRPL